MTSWAKPRVERMVSYVRSNFFAGEQFVELADCRRRAQLWCAEVAGQRIHGTTRARPAEVFAEQEAPLLGPAPAGKALLEQRAPSAPPGSCR